jgi:hypothetical protein
MRFILILLGCLGTWSSFAAIDPPLPNYTIDGAGNIVDANGEIDDDPEQQTALTTNEIQAITGTITQADATLKARWLKRQQVAKTRAATNPNLIKQ